MSGPRGNRIPHVVITGAPITGKTTVVESFRDNPDIAVIEEAATWLLENEYPPVSEDNPWTYEWQLGLVRRVIQRTIEREEEVQERAAAEGKKLIVQDRGLLDTAPFLNDGVIEFDKLSPIRANEVLGRYHSVILLGWLGPSVKDPGNNAARFHDLAEAERLVEPTRRAYSSHPNFIAVNSVEDRTERVADIVAKIIQTGESGHSLA